jgi:hypothetical protein
VKSIYLKDLKKVFIPGPHQKRLLFQKTKLTLWDEFKCDLMFYCNIISAGNGTDKHGRFVIITYV